MQQYYVNFNLIRVSTFDEDSDELEESGPYFLIGELSDSITNPYSREFKTVIFVFKNARINVNERIKHEIEGVKNSQKKRRQQKIICQLQG